MTTLETLAPENRCSEHLAEIDAKAQKKRKSFYIPIPKVELPASTKERAKLWDDCILETALGLRHLLYSDDPDTARWAIEQLVALEKTSVRHNRRLAGTERPNPNNRVFNIHGELVDPEDLPAPVPIPAADPAKVAEHLELSRKNEEKFQRSAFNRHVRVLQGNIDRTIDELPAEVFAEKDKANVKKVLPPEFAAWLVHGELLHQEVKPASLEPTYFAERVKTQYVIFKYVEHATKPVPEILRAFFGNNAEEIQKRMEMQKTA